MRKLYIRPLIVLITMHLVFACSTTKNVVDTPHSQYQLQDISHLDNRQRADLYEAIIAADLAQHKKDYQTATSYYLFAADVSRNMALIQNSVKMAQAAKDPLALQQAAQLWLELEPDSISAQSLVLESQLEQQDGPGALISAKQYLAGLKSSEDRYSLIETSIITQDPRTAFNLLRELQLNMPNEVAIPAGIGKLFMRLGYNSQQPENILTQALGHTDSALKLNPLFYPAVRNKSHILVQLRRDDVARNYLSNLFYENQDSAELNLMLGQLLYDLQDYPASIVHFSDWLSNHPGDLESRFYLAASHYASSQFAAGLPHFVKLAEQAYRLDKVAFYCGDSAMKSGAIEQAIACFEIVDQGRFHALAKVFLSRLYAGQKNLDKAFSSLAAEPHFNEEDQIKLIGAELDLLLEHYSREQAQTRLTTAIEQFPQSLPLLLRKIELFDLGNHPQKLLEVLHQARDMLESTTKLDDFNLAAAALLNNHGHSQQAIDWLNQALESKPDDKDLLYTRALYKEPLGLYDEMVQEFKYLNQLFPDDLNIKNALGYTLADLGRELDLAKSLIDEAYQGLPNNPAVIDSKGWIAFRLGQMDEAIAYLTKAFTLSPSADVAAHLGEVLWQQNKKEQARQIWLQGLELDRNNGILNKTLERLKIEL